MKKVFLILLVAALFFTGCTRDQKQQGKTPEKTDTVKTQAVPAEGDPAIFTLIEENAEPAKIEELAKEKPASLTLKNEDGDTPLIYAAMRGNDEAIKTLINSGADVKAENDPTKYTALHRYVKNTKASKEIVELLLEKGADINAKDDYGNTPLHEAVNFDIVELLVEKGADLKAVNSNYEETVLISYAKSSRDDENKLKVIEYYIDKGLDVNAVTKYNVTALQQAAYTGTPKTVELLLKKGADPKIKNAEDKTALDMAKEAENQEVITILEKLK